MATQAYRKISKVFSPQFKNEGVGVKVLRIIGGEHCRRLDPFLMLDFAHLKLPAGFPDHPHRGFETVSYLLKGTMLHEDFKGNKGTLQAGDVQWMTAGKGMVHSEMPASFTEEAIGFQLWINLEKKDKMCEPQYQEIKSDKLPIVQKDGVWIRLIAGEAFGQKGPIFTRTPAFYMDVRLEKNVKFNQQIPKEFQGMVFLYEGSLVLGQNQQKVLDKQVAIFEPDTEETINITASQEGAKFLLIAGKPIKEPVYSYGPFVLDSQQNLNTTFEDYQEEKNGFEGARGWQSEIQFLAELKNLK
ncbi:hypothetical protein ABPG72_008549 [Tetrahymena utriculariae]